MALVGRTFEIREVKFDSLGPTPCIAGISLRACGPVGLKSLTSLALRAEAEARALGHSPDAFVIVGLSGVGLLALIPNEPPRDAEDRERIVQLLGLYEPIPS